MVWKFLSKTFGTVVYAIQYGCIAHCTLEYVADFVVCHGPSMQPTIQSNDIVITEHVSVMRKQVQKGDIVISRSPTNPRQHICKRVIAMEGDKVFSVDDTFRYVPRGHVWLEGDNHSNSTDSNCYGPVPYAMLRSRVIYKIWPFHESKSLIFPDDR